MIGGDRNGPVIHTEYGHERALEASTRLFAIGAPKEIASYERVSRLCGRTQQDLIEAALSSVPAHCRTPIVGAAIDDDVSYMTLPEQQVTLFGHIAEGGWSKVRWGYDWVLQQLIVGKEFRQSNNATAVNASYVNEQEVGERLYNEDDGRFPISPAIVFADEANDKHHTPILGFEFSEAVDENVLTEQQEWSYTLGYAAYSTAEDADLVHRMHHAGVVHHDLKPANVLLLIGEGRRQFCDLGLARTLETLETHPVTGGSPAYAAPEQFGSGSTGKDSDKFALASIAFERLTGQRPFEGDSIGSIYQQKANGLSAGKRHLLRDPRLGLPPKIVDVVESSLHFDPSTRISLRIFRDTFIDWHLSLNGHLLPSHLAGKIHTPDEYLALTPEERAIPLGSPDVEDGIKAYRYADLTKVGVDPARVAPAYADMFGGKHSSVAYLFPPIQSLSGDLQDDLATKKSLKEHVVSNTPDLPLGEPVSNDTPTVLAPVAVQAA